MKRLSLLMAMVGVAGASLATAGGSGYAWHLTPTGSDARLRGLSAVSANAAWASGSLGTVLRTVNRGSTWEQVGPPGTQDLQFRDVEAFDANRAVILSIGNGPDSRIYVTSDAGRHWSLTFVNPDPNAFYDCMTFFDDRRGLALSDPPDGQKFRILATSDGGRHWRVVDPFGMPQALPGEFAFAASGQCITSDHGHRAWFGTGGGAQARVFRSNDRGQTWKVSPTPIRSGPAAGIFALAFRGQQHGLAVGGDFLAPTASPDNFALTRDGGTSWQLVPGAPPEYRSGATWVDGHTAIAVGPSGSNVSQDAGRTWQRFDDGSFDTTDCARPNACWAAGEHGRVAYLTR
ncbi:MAG: oxidoreductase [Actinomycetota bacterium]|nr:oxidoreductase [Actinomycetota bacterium]